ncbi:sulfurtransferase TusA family protein [Garciella nitratireducens]|uniref:TusA-related sulfurtransferase n=1 Tax=Garciella nitratireducens DSM 15102 TaxID=1121911 RepID=A0A1T4P9I9_9FIRM|nr:sulfurtransferase TusA family protein [Garciella nitratireducens]SJZ88162.1 TusA-related sulfurtransferase [Garciella nitratireducens DSM 15102]
MKSVQKVDARGMSCPQPVLITKNAIQNNPGDLEIVVDSNTAKNNVMRFLKHSGYKVDVEVLGEDLLIKASR